MKEPLLRSSVLLATLCLFLPVAWILAQDPPAQAGESGEEPLDVDLVERTERRLTQLDITIHKKKKAAEEPPELSVDDLEVVVAGERVELRYRAAYQKDVSQS